MLKMDKEQRQSRPTTIKLKHNGKCYSNRMAPPEARSERYGGYSSTFNSYDSAESTVVVNTDNCHAASRKKRRQLTQSDSEGEGSHTPGKESEHENSIVSPTQQPMDIVQDEKHDSALKRDESSLLVQNHESNSPTDYGGEPYWGLNTSAIQGLVSLMDKAGREEQQQRIEAERKLAVAETALASARLDLADERKAHGDTKSRTKRLQLELDEYKKTKEDCDHEHSKHKADIEQRNEELRRQLQTAIDEHDSERKTVARLRTAAHKQQQKLDKAAKDSQSRASRSQAYK